MVTEYIVCRFDISSLTALVGTDQFANMALDTNKMIHRDTEMAFG